MRTQNRAAQRRRKPSIIGRQDPAWQTAHNLRDWPYRRQYHAFRAWDRKFDRLHPENPLFRMPTNGDVLDAFDSARAAMVSDNLWQFIREMMSLQDILDHATLNGIPSNGIPSASPRAQAALPLARYGFRDPIGHPLENCVEYQQMVSALRLAITAIEHLGEVSAFSKLPWVYREDALAALKAALGITGAPE